MRLGLGIIALLMIGFNASAAVEVDDNGTSTGIKAAAPESTLTVIFPSAELTSDPVGFWGFVGLGSGFMNYNNREGLSNGPQLNVKAIGSYYTASRQWVFDTGLGLQTGSIDNGRVDKNINSATMELGAYYRPTSLWHVGPTAQVLVGNGENYSSGSRELTSFIGVGGFRDIDMHGTLARLGGRVMTDLGIPGKVTTLAMIELQVSLPMARRSTSYTYYNQEPEPPATASSEDESGKVRAAVIKMHQRPLRYEVGSALPRMQDWEFLKSLGQTLAKNESLFEEVRIIGHADQRGSENANRILSSSRAQTVMQAFVQSGVSVNKVKTYAFGESRPLSKDNTPSAWTLNRRVEIQFLGVKNPQRLNEIISSLQE